MASFISFLHDNQNVCTIVSTVLEASNKLASNKIKITKKAAVLAKLGK